MQKVESGIIKYREFIKKTGLKYNRYQEIGVRFMLEKEHTESRYKIRGGILADDMGMGKTIQILGLIYSNIKKRTLIIVPRGILEQWERIIYDILGYKSNIYHGIRKDKDRIEDSLLTITTYGTIITERATKEIHSKEWGRIIYDEAHHMRNKKGKYYESATRLRGENIWLLTGTPIQNQLSDFKSLCSILGINPDVMKNIDIIQKIKREIVLRRMKEEVGIEIKRYNTEDVYVDWETEEEYRFAYDMHSIMEFTNITRSNVNKLIKYLSNSGVNVSILLRMRQICICPATLIGYNEELVDDGIIGEEESKEILKGMSKINKVINDIKIRKTNGNKKIIFTYFRKEIEILEKRLSEEGMIVGVINGSTTHRQREEILNDKGIDILILQIMSANEGLNLQEYNEIYFTSPHWNPSVEDQAICRSYRMGQKKEVQVYRYIMKGFGKKSISIEEYILEIQGMKREIMKIFDN